MCTEVLNKCNYYMYFENFFTFVFDLKKIKSNNTQTALKYFKMFSSNRENLKSGGGSTHLMRTRLYAKLSVSA